MQDENSVVSALTGFSLDHVLSSLQLPGGSGLNNRLGIAGLPELNAKQIYNDDYDEDEEEAIPLDAGRDWEDEVDREFEDEDDEDEVAIKDEAQSPQAFQRRRRTRLIRRLVERPKTVYERFPAFEQGKVLDFTELFKGYTTHRSRVSKRPFQGMLLGHKSTSLIPNVLQSRRYFHVRRRCRKVFSQPLLEIRNGKLRTRGWKRLSRPVTLR